MQGRLPSDRRLQGAAAVRRRALPVPRARAPSIDAQRQDAVPAYHVKRFEGIPVAFIGLTLKDTPTIVVPSGVAGLTLPRRGRDRQRAGARVAAQGIEAIVVLIHEGGMPTGDYNECPGISGPIVDIVKKLDKAVDVVISGHTHRAYNCRIDGRLVTSGDKYGTIVTRDRPALDPKTGDVTDARGRQRDRAHDRFAKDAAQTEADRGLRRARRAAGQAHGRPHGAPLTRDANAAGESAIGHLVADAQLAATRDAGAQIALMNPGGLRAT